MWQSKEWLETAISTHNHNRTIQKIVSLSEEAVTAKGENYTSDLIRLVAEGVQGSGDVIKKTFVLKLLPTVPVRRMVAQQVGLFQREIKVFNSVLIEMEKLMESVQDWREPLWGKCLASNVQIGILFEDLRPLGYKSGDRKLGFDIPHAKVALSALGRFHAMSVVLHDNFYFSKGDFSSYVFANVDSTVMQKFTSDGLSALGDIMTSSWPKQWHSMGERIKSISNTFLNKMFEITREENSEFKVLNHGDPWVNNMMFKYDMETGNVCSIRFVDFQISHWNSPACDLQYFIRSSLRYDLVTKHYDELLSCYYNSLMNTFKVMQHEPKITLTLPQLHKDMDRFSGVGFMTATLILPTLLAETDDVIDFEVQFAEDAPPQDVPLKRYESKAFTESMMNTLPLFQNKDIF